MLSYKYQGKSQNHLTFETPSSIIFRSVVMKKSWKVLALVMMLVFSVTAVYASGNKEEVTTNSSSNTSSTKTTSKNTATQTSDKGTAKKLYTELPAGTDGSAGTSAKYVLFGEWPQTIMAEGVTIDKTKTRQQGAMARGTTKAKKTAMTISNTVMGISE